VAIAISILLSVLFLGFVFLYIKSNNKEKWRKYLLLLVGIPFAVFLSIFIYLVIEKQAGKLSNKTDSQKETSIKGINLGDSLSDLQFKYGKFTKEKDQNRGYDLYNVSSVLTIWVKDNKVQMITYECEKTSDFTVLGQVQCGDDGESIIKQYSEKNVDIKCFSGDDTKRFYSVEKKNLGFILERNRVVRLQSNAIQIEKTMELKNCS